MTQEQADALLREMVLIRRALDSLARSQKSSLAAHRADQRRAARFEREAAAAHRKARNEGDWPAAETNAERIADNDYGRRGGDANGNA